MNLTLIIKEVLESLFEGYIEHGGTPIFDVSQIIRHHNEDPNEIGKYLVDHGWLKFHQFRYDGFHASISMAGIRKIKPEYISDNRNKIISTLGLIGNGRMGIMEILDFEPKNYQIAFDLAKEFEREGIITAQYHHNEVIISLTLKGRDEYEQNNANFL